MLCGGLKYDLAESKWPLYHLCNPFVFSLGGTGETETAARARMCSLMSESKHIRDLNKLDNLLYCCHQQPQWRFSHRGSCKWCLFSVVQCSRRCRYSDNLFAVQFLHQRLVLFYFVKVFVCIQARACV